MDDCLEPQAHEILSALSALVTTGEKQAGVEATMAPLLFSIAVSLKRIADVMERHFDT